MQTQHHCTEEYRITRNEQDIQTIFNDAIPAIDEKVDKMKDMRIANLSMQVLSLLGIIATMAAVLIK